MEFINATRMQAGYTMGLEPSGRESIVVVIKGTFVLPKPGEQVRLHDEQMPLVVSDTFTGAPGFSAPMYESDFAPRKQLCDVLLLGSAHAPEGRPVSRVQVHLQVGAMTKSFDVVGNRVWRTGGGTIRPSEPVPFVKMPITYDLAFGGSDTQSPDSTDHFSYGPNPVGRGYRKQLRAAKVDGSPLPNTEESGQAVTWPANHYRPMAFGPIARAWPPRAAHAGTYDEAWLEDGFPFLPKDFDDMYFQAAPSAQRTPIPVGSTHVLMRHLTPNGLCEFELPWFDAPVHVFPKRAPGENLKAVMDTVLLEPDKERFTVLWRVARPLARSMFEISQILIGRKGKAWWQQREEVAFPIRLVSSPLERRP